nr:PREDICTED: coiled-coil domain-containing protein 38-like [Bemisia tabaci]
MDSDVKLVDRFGESRISAECRELVKKLRAKKRIMSPRKHLRTLPSIDNVPGKPLKSKERKTHPDREDFCSENTKLLPYNQLQKDSRKKFRSQPYWAKDTYRSALTRDLPLRTHVINMITKKELQEIQDVDSEFFASIKYKIPRNKVDVRSYVQIIRSILSTQVCTGYLFDEATLIKENFLEEKSILNAYTKKFQVYAGKLENHMAAKHAESMKLLRLSVIATNETEKKHEEVAHLKTELNRIKLLLIELEDVWKKFRMYQDFLIQISPIMWRKENDKHYNALATNPFLDTPSRQMLTGVDKYDLLMNGSIECLEELMILFLRDFQDINKPILYFKKPEQIKEIFHELELKNLNSLLHLRELQEPEQIMKTGLEISSKYYSRESQNIANRLAALEQEVQEEHQRKEKLKRKVETLLEGVLRRLLASKEILCLQVFIEDVYTTCVGPVDWRMSVLNMMQTIEHHIQRQCMLLDSYPPKIVSDATKQEQKATEQARRIALEARRKVLDLDSLLKAMKRLLKRVTVRPSRMIKFRSHLPQKMRKAAPVQSKETKQQDEDKYFFTQVEGEALHYNSLSRTTM